MSPLQYAKALKREFEQGVGSLFKARPLHAPHGPDFVCFGITDDCILKCKMCYKWKKDIFIKQRETNTPTLKDWKNCVSSLREIARGPLQINFGGGEPLLKDGILELVSFCGAKGFKTNIASNGYLVDEARARSISRSGLDSIILSLDSLVEETHDYLRGVAGAQRRVLEAIDLLDRFSGGVYKGLCCVIYEKNLEDVLKLANWVDSDRRINSIYFMAAMQPNNSVSNERWYERDEFSMLWPQDRQRACFVIDELIKLKKRGSKITNQIAQLEAFKLYYLNPQRFVKNTKCDMDSALHVSSCGDIFLCYRWEKIGNIQTDCLSRVWRGQRAEEARKDIAACKNNCHFLLNCFFTGGYPFELAGKG